LSAFEKRIGVILFTPASVLWADKRTAINKVYGSLWSKGISILGNKSSKILIIKFIFSDLFISLNLLLKLILMNTLKIGDKIPEFDCLDNKGNNVSSSDFAGKKLIVFFYPRANTPGCTAEACNLSENYKELTDNGYSIVGVSCDKVETQNKFSNKFGFQYPLLADTDKKLVKLFGVWGPKKFMGREYEGIHRMTFIFDENSVVSRVIEKVNTKNPTDQILKG